MSEIINKKKLMIIASVFVVALFFGTAANPAFAEPVSVSSTSDSETTSAGLEAEMEKLIREISSEEITSVESEKTTVASKEDEASKEIVSKEDSADDSVTAKSANEEQESEISNDIISEEKENFISADEEKQELTSAKEDKQEDKKSNEVVSNEEKSDCPLCDLLSEKEKSKEGATPVYVEKEKSKNKVISSSDPSSLSEIGIKESELKEKQEKMLEDESRLNGLSNSEIRDLAEAFLVLADNNMIDYSKMPSDFSNALSSVGGSGKYGSYGNNMGSMGSSFYDPSSGSMNGYNNYGYSGGVMGSYGGSGSPSGYYGNSMSGGYSMGYMDGSMQGTTTTNLDGSCINNCITIATNIASGFAEFLVESELVPKLLDIASQINLLLNNFANWAYDEIIDALGNIVSLIQYTWNNLPTLHEIKAWFIDYLADNSLIDIAKDVAIAFLFVSAAAVIGYLVVNFLKNKINSALKIIDWLKELPVEAIKALIGPQLDTLKEIFSIPGVKTGIKSLIVIKLIDLCKSLSCDTGLVHETDYVKIDITPDEPKVNKKVRFKTTLKKEHRTYEPNNYMVQWDFDGDGEKDDEAPLGLLTYSCNSFCSFKEAGEKSVDYRLIDSHFYSKESGYDGTTIDEGTFTINVMENNESAAATTTATGNTGTSNTNTQDTNTGDSNTGNNNAGNNDAGESNTGDTNTGNNNEGGQGQESNDCPDQNDDQNQDTAPNNIPPDDDDEDEDEGDGSNDEDEPEALEAVIFGPSSGDTGEELSFYGYDSTGDIVQYDWYGRKSGELFIKWHNDEGPSFDAKYSTGGSRTIKLRVHSSDGSTDMDTKTIDIDGWL